MCQGRKYILFIFRGVQYQVAIAGGGRDLVTQGWGTGNNKSC